MPSARWDHDSKCRGDTDQTMAKKRVYVTVTAPGMFQSEYYAKARDETGRMLLTRTGRTSVTRR